MNSFVSGILMIALVNLTPVQTQEEHYAAGLSAYNEGNFEVALSVWGNLAKQGDARAQYALGVMYEFGQGVEHSYATAARWYEKAATKGYAMARNNLAMLFEDGLGVVKSEEKAVNYYHQAALQGLPSSQYNLALMFYEGIGVEQNYSVAVQWLHKSATQGFASAQYNLGIMYQKGQGTEQDHVEAAKWFIEAINTGAKKARGGLQALLEEKFLATTAATVSVRQEPRTSAGVVTQLTEGQRVYALQQNGHWVAVLLDDYQTVGWIESAQLQ